jgi:hypothetical protein
MKLSQALILGAAIMIAAPAYAQQYDGQRTPERQITTKVQHKRVAPRSQHVVARSTRYDVRQERQTTAELNRRSMQGQDSNDYNR